jgi:serine/threonine-protein kinase RsbW
MAKPTEVEVTLETRVESVDLAEEVASRVAAAAGFDEEDRHKISMAVRESVINAVQHGNRLDKEKKVQLAFIVEPRHVTITVTDQGNGFDVNSIPDPRLEANLLKTAGRGIFLIRTFMDEFHVEYRAGQGTRVTMVKRASSTGPVPGQPDSTPGRV